jgi:hypothetical protein
VARLLDQSVLTDTQHLGCREIPIALKIPEKGEQKAQSCDIACLQHLTIATLDDETGYNLWRPTAEMPVNA